MVATLTNANIKKEEKALTTSQIRKMVCVLAYQILQADKEISQSVAMKMAWSEVKNFPEKFCFVRYKKVSGKVVNKVVMTGHITQYYTPNGNGRPLKEGLKLYIDAGHHLTGKYAVRSFYKANLINHFSIK